VRVGLAIYGSLETLSGGYLYDRMLVEYLQSCGDQVQVITLPWQNYFFHLSHNFTQSTVDRFYKLDVDVLVQDELNHPSFAWMNQRLVERTSYPVISIVHHLRTSEKHPKSLKWIYRQVEKAYLQSIDGFIFNSEATRHAVEALRGEKVSGVVAYPSGNRFDVTISPHTIVQRAHAAGPFKMIFVGNIIPRKGLHTLIESLGLIHDLDWQLSIIGKMDVDPDYIQQIHRLVEAKKLKNKVEFFGKLPAEQLKEKFMDSHSLVVPSTYEGFGIVYLEAMGFGVVPIATTAGGAREIIFSGQDGYLVPVEDVLVLADRLRCIIEDRSQLAGMGIAALQKFHKFPSWENTGAAIRNYLLSMVNEKENRL
jgi:glycosyltransferase involved in cell wall biosynthesis